MLVSELAERAEVPLATVKYYLREGLLPPGRATGPRRAEYDEVHLRRLRVLRLLREVGGVHVTSLRQVVEALDDMDLPVHAAIAVIADVVAARPDPGDQDPVSLTLIDDVLRDVGWDAIRADSIDRLRLASLVSLINGAGPLTATPEVLGYYAHAADHMARTEVSMLHLARERDELLEEMLTGSVVYGQIYALLRQMGHEHHHRQVTQAPVPG